MMSRPTTRKKAGRRAQKKAAGKGSRLRGSRAGVILGLAVIMAAASLGVAYRGPLASRAGGGAASASPPQGQLSLAKEYVYAGGRLLATEEPEGGGCGTPPGSPGNSLVATATSGTQAVLSWASTGADHYEVERRANINASWTTLTPNPTTNSFTDNGLTSNTSYLYRVRAVDGSGCPSGYSNTDLATTMIYAENVVAGVTIKAAHMLEMKTAVNAVRAAAALGAFDWVDASAPAGVVAPAVGGSIMKNHVQKLRNRLDDARTALGLPAALYSDQPLATGITVQAVHVQQLREGVK
jgi:hypothetical protein